MELLKIVDTTHCKAVETSSLKGAIMGERWFECCSSSGLEPSHGSSDIASIT